MTLFNTLFFVHIVGGAISLLLGSYILLTKKGGKTHRLLGNIFL